MASYLIYVRLHACTDSFRPGMDDGLLPCKDNEALVAAVGNIIAWLCVMLHWSRHPLMSVYTTKTFAIIAWKYFQVLIFYSPILIGFAVCFVALFQKSGLSPNNSGRIQQAAACIN